MRGVPAPLATILVLSVCLVAQAAPVAGELSFEERLAAQEAIERVFYAYQIGATRPFEEAVPREVLERKVRTYLAQSVALDRMWHTPVTAEMLQHELERMASRTRMPERLQELFAALADDPVLIQECLARQVLVNRLARNFFAFDPQIHAQARQDAVKLHSELTEGRRDLSEDHPARNVVALERREGATSDSQPDVDRDRRAIELEPEEFDRLRGLAPRQVGTIGPVNNEREAYTLRVVLEEQTGRVTIATYVSPKRTWSAWWSELGSELDGRSVEVVARNDLPLPHVPIGEGQTCEIDTWDNGILDDLPGHRSGHSAVWTGTRMILWGGVIGGTDTQTGMAYDPATDSWTTTSTLDAPSPRAGHHAVWTGDLMVVWGGGYLANTGGRYDPITDSWTATSTVGAPSGRWSASSVWTGEAMIIWGGSSEGGVVFNSGGRYNPVLDSWSSTNNVTGPEARGEHEAVWTGDRMIIWGGWTESGNVNTGWSYNPTNNSWSPLSTIGAVSARNHPSVVWTGTEMIVWGGHTSEYLNTGGRYNPTTDSWGSMTTVGAPEGRDRHSAIWTGSKMIVWGGEYGWLDTGGRYDPTTDSWAPTSTLGAPEGRSSHTTVWTGDRMIVWGGYSYNEGFHQFASGGRYDPVSDSWTPTYAPGAPEGRGYHTAVWTGNEMIVWGGGYWTGGDGQYINPIRTGSRYSPVTDSWSPTSDLNAPGDRFDHTAVWTGSYMVIWGGTDGANDLAGGGRYEPISDSWGTTSLVNAPSGREGHTAVWTGTEMIVWGGSSAPGGRYKPYIDVWTPVSNAGSPSPRQDHVAVWTGTEMIVWGGFWQGDRFNTGGRYHAVSDTWMPMSIVDAPTERYFHTATWNGNEMIVWGGYDGALANTGGLYDAATDIWEPTSTDDAPSARADHTAVWVGDRMIVWGGSADNTGGLYDPLEDSWAPTSTVGTPPARAGHVAIDAGDKMFVWGGGGPLSDGGRYYPNGLDGDNDGHGCAVDCDNANSGVFAPPGLVRGVRFAADGERLQWISQTPTAGIGTVYDIVRGVVSELPVGSGPSETCLASDYASASADPGMIEWVETESPASGAAFWYLIKADNACAQGRYGAASSGAARLTTACP